MIKEITNKTEWNAILAQVDSYDFYHTYDYHHISLKENQKPILIVYQKDNSLIALPLILRDIPGTNYFDFTSVYGYVGPLFKLGEDYSDFNLFHTELNNYFVSKNIVSVFSRLHPYLNQETALDTLGDIKDLGQVVNIDLTLSLELSRSKYAKSNKNQINKLRRNSTIIKAKTFEEIDIFIDIYYENMKRINADDSYYFNRQYFHDFMKINDFKTDILLVKDNETDIFIAGSMFVKTDKIVQFHLSGTRTDFLRSTPAKLFLDEMRIIATQEGYKYFNLGGGLGSENDSLFDFKSSFSKDFRTFKIWKYITNQDVYNKLSSKSIEGAFFPKYRSKSI